jgi:hypothetical protein
MGFAMTFKPDPDAYAAASLPHESDESANAALLAFSEEVRALRMKHHVSTLLTVALVNVLGEDGKVRQTCAFGRHGDPQMFEPMAAMALGEIRRQHDAEIARRAGLDEEET